MQLERVKGWEAAGFKLKGSKVDECSQDRRGPPLWERRALARPIAKLELGAPKIK